MFAQTDASVFGQLAEALETDWQAVARPSQLPPPGDGWTVWLILAGRGWGKTRTGAEWARAQIKAGCSRLALVAATAADARDVMVEGDSGIMTISPDHDRPEYEPSKRRLTWSSGAIATLFSADEPERLRGPQFDGAWCDEIGTWRYQDAWDQLQFGLRIKRRGRNPRVVVTTTPRPTKLIRDLVAREGRDVIVTRGTTYENRDNLASGFFTQIVSRFEGTRLGRQELNAELLEDVPGALWKREWIDRDRVSTAPELKLIVVAIDPAVSSGDEADETGIVAAGVGGDGHGYVLDDASLRGAPHDWARRAIDLYRRRDADRIIAEKNNGGDMVEATIRMVDKNISFRAVHASRGKVTRAEPVSALYEQRKVHHVGEFSELEDQLCAFTSDFDRGRAGYSPDRLDALVWALSELMVVNREVPVAVIGTFQMVR